ncbi:MAG TPA: pyridoxamine 5'-phosphate oxidase family protein [Candidatus Sulfotelmatobacter sp.]|nr:pyridoxamine 5'-phosphate oxidase family protein [Candidatus Sulfotelmatobacter sp.]
MSGLSAAGRDLLQTARRAVLATVAADGRPRLVPICYWTPAGEPLVVYSALDDKPKAVADPLRLARVRDLVARPQVTLLVDRWDEDWRRLAWLRLDGAARVLGPSRPGAADAAEHAAAVAGLRGRYPQYRDHDLAARPLIRMAVDHVVEWSAA